MQNKTKTSDSKSEMPLEIRELFKNLQKKLDETEKRIEGLYRNQLTPEEVTGLRKQTPSEMMESMRIMYAEKKRGYDEINPSKTLADLSSLLKSLEDLNFDQISGHKELEKWLNLSTEEACRQMYLWKLAVLTVKAWQDNENFLNGLFEIPGLKKGSLDYVRAVSRRLEPGPKILRFTKKDLIEFDKDMIKLDRNMKFPWMKKNE